MAPRQGGRTRRHACKRCGCSLPACNAGSFCPAGRCCLLTTDQQQCALLSMAPMAAVSQCTRLDGLQVEEEKKEEATVMFQRINAAYQARPLLCCVMAAA